MYNGTSDDLNFIIRYFLPSLFRRVEINYTEITNG